MAQSVPGKLAFNAAGLAFFEQVAKEPEPRKRETRSGLTPLNFNLPHANLPFSAKADVDLKDGHLPGASRTSLDAHSTDPAHGVDAGVSRSISFAVPAVVGPVPAAAQHGGVIASVPPPALLAGGTDSRSGSVSAQLVAAAPAPVVTSVALPPPMRLVSVGSCANQPAYDSMSYRSLPLEVTQQIGTPVIGSHRSVAVPIAAGYTASAGFLPQGAEQPTAASNCVLTSSAVALSRVSSVSLPSTALASPQAPASCGGTPRTTVMCKPLPASRVRSASAGAGYVVQVPLLSLDPQKWTSGQFTPRAVLKGESPSQIGFSDSGWLLSPASTVQITSGNCHESPRPLTPPRLEPDAEPGVRLGSPATPPYWGSGGRNYMVKPSTPRREKKDVSIASRTAGDAGGRRESVIRSVSWSKACCGPAVVEQPTGDKVSPSVLRCAQP